jgi:hypothetical protein
LADGDLRETFDPGALVADDLPPAAGSGRRSRRVADAAALFCHEPALGRTTAADERKRARPCPSCGGIVPVGMALCPNCGLDLETGMRVDLDELIEDAPPPVFHEDAPVSALLVGGFALLASLALTGFAFLKWTEGLAGAEFLGLVGLFAVFASVQFLLGKSAKPLLIALALGATIDLIGLIALPVYRAQEEPVVERPVSEVEERPEIRPYAERLDTQSITWGIVLMVLCSGIAIYLVTPSAQRHLRRF